MPIEIEMPEELDGGGGNFLRAEGTYHLQVVDTEEEPTSRDGKLLDGFRVKFSVLDGTVRENGKCTEVDKEVEIMFYAPKLSSKDGGEWANRKRGRFLIAVGLSTESATGQRVKVELSDAVNRQLIIKLVLGSENGSGKRYLEPNFADIWHVDDPAVKDIPKSAAGLKLLPAALRRKPESFAKPKAEASNGHAEKPTKRETVAASAPAGDAADDLGDM